MPRYALFTGTDHEASGGWDDLDFIGTLDECKARVPSRAVNQVPEWAHIVDLDAGTVVQWLVWTYDPEPPLVADAMKPRWSSSEWVGKTG